MNYLAHILLSYPNEQEMLGNFLGDFVRKKDMDILPNRVQEGVLLHREIDYYTDQHLAVRNSVDLLRPHIGRYAFVAIDIINDHFLSQQWSEYSILSLRAFCNDFYSLMKSNRAILPPKLQRQMDAMIDHDFLMSTADHFRLFKTMKHMEKRTSFRSNFTFALPIVKTNETVFQENFQKLFKDLILLCETRKIKSE